MNEAKDRVIDKVRGLFAKTTENGASDAEAQTAMSIALSLMDKHHLTEADLSHEPADDYSKVDGAAFGRFRSFIGKSTFQWESWLSTFVAKFVGCPVYRDPDVMMVRKNGFVQFDKKDNPKYGMSFVFYGVAEDARMAVEIYDELRVLIATMAVAKYGMVYKGEGGAYAEGFVLGLLAKFEISKNLEHQEAKSSSTAMILSARREDLIKYKEEKSNQWIKKEHKIEFITGPNRKGVGGGDKARSEGMRDGQNTDVNNTRRRKIGV